MTLIRNVVSAMAVSAGLVAAFGLLFVAAGSSAQAAAVPGPIVAACSGACVFSNGSCYSDPTDDCKGTGCSCKGSSSDCGCKK